MPNILDDIKKIEKLDKEKTAKSIELLCAQARQVLGDAVLIKIPKEYKTAKKVVINGMGASNLGAGIFKAVFADRIKAPIIIAPGYEVPAFVDKETIYILSSYSGNTEETLSVYAEAKKRGAKILGMAGGGKLADIMIKNDIPGYIYKPNNNPCGVPRFGLGYSIFGMAVLLARAGLFEIKTKEMEGIIADLELWDRKLRPEIKTNLNIAKKLALAVHNKEVILIGAEFLQGNLRALRNQFCETGKNFASYLILPELNHYAMEGLGFPKANKKNLVFFFFDSDFYSVRVQERMRLTKEVIKKNKIKTVEYKLRGKSKMEQAFEMLQIGSWTTFYLAMLNGVNPAPNPWVDWFKDKLK